MRFFHFLDDADVPSLGVLQDGGTFLDLSSEGIPTLDEVLRQGAAGMAAAREAVARASHRRPLQDIRYLPPVLSPSKALAIGLNYVDHAKESKFPTPEYPVIFQRYPSSWVAHEQALICPFLSGQFDYEAELVAVIGKEGRHIRREHALDHVAGYSLFNDGSVRDYQFRSAQWTIGKNFDASGSFGPFFVSADELPAGASGLRLQCRLNGQVVQDANTRDMIFDVATLVAACSESMTLMPGDLIITGTPSGVGLAREPQLWMKPGDVCEVEAEGLGTLRNTIVAEKR